jgi:hypothetical protein
MIPRTFPSTFETTNGQQRVVVFFLSSITGLERWVDYIPVKFVQYQDQEVNTYNAKGIHLVDPLDSTSGKQAWVDYIPVYQDSSATDATLVSANGFIPVGFNTAPTLSLDFTDSAETLDSRITFSRGSSGTRFNSSGVLESISSNNPRFDYDPVTLAPKGLLIEEQRTNLMTYSEQFDNAAWAKGNSSVSANTITSPDGTIDGDKLVENTSNSTHTVDQTFSFTSGTAYTASVYVKAGERPTIQMVIVGTAFNESRTWFNLSTLTATTTSGSVTSSFITPVGNGWYRVGVTQSAIATNTANISFRIWNGSTALYTGDGTSGVYLWGAQLEAGAFATSYIPTTTAQVTRSADVASITGANFSSWYNATEGTLYGEASTYDVSTGRTSFAVTDGSTSNRIHLNASTSVKVFIANGGATQLTQAIPSVTYTNNTFSKTALAYANNDGNGAANGTIATNDTSLSVPTVNQAQIGALTSTNSILNGTIKKVAYYPARLSNVQLQALTS